MDDIMIINGSTSRIDRDFYLEAVGEQLIAGDISVRIVDSSEVSISSLSLARGFLLFNTDVNDRFRRFIEMGKEMNKTFFRLSLEADDGSIEQLEDIIDHQLIISKWDEANGQEGRIPRNLSEVLMDKLQLNLPVDKRDALFISLGNDSFQKIVGDIENFLSVSPDRRAYLVNDVDLGHVSRGNKGKYIQVDLEDSNQILNAINRSVMGLFEQERTQLELYFEKLLVVSKSPVLILDEEVIKLGIDFSMINDQDKYSADLYMKSHEVIHKYGSVYAGHTVRKLILDKLSPSIAFNLPGLKVGGGVLVALKHAEVLQKNGYDVTIISDQVYDHGRIYNTNGISLPTISRWLDDVSSQYDKMVATLWNTYFYVKSYRKVKERYYLVQGFETDFTKFNREPRFQANITYFDDEINYVPVSPWCEDWLRNDYGRTKVQYVKNGLEPSRFEFRKRERKEKFRILIEGNPFETYRGVDEAFRITNELDRSKFEVYFLSNKKGVKDWYIIDKSFFQIPHEEVSEVFSSCDLLLKCSVLESFSYPPLEMMSTGGVCVVARNDGNKVYTRNRENCLLYNSGDTHKAREMILELSNDRELYDKLVEGGVKTAEEYSWEAVEGDILKAYK